MINYIKRASELLGVGVSQLKTFSYLDIATCNNIEGVICRKPDYRYGSMVLFRVNEILCENLIYCTPKIEYPFNRKGEYEWPKVSQIELWDKLDGTNILAYWYEVDGTKYLSFKTRLTPILKDGKFGGFLSLWNEYYKENPWVEQVILANPDYNLSFELYGSRNPITIEYKTPLDVALLFGIRQSDHAVKPPSQLILPEGTKVPHNTTIYSVSDLTKLYKSMKEKMSEINKESLTVEGLVMYAFCNEPSWRQFKIKPNEITSIHWASGGILWNDIWTTAINSFEEGDSSIDYVIELLKEEYTDQQIEKAGNKIIRCFYEVEKHIELVNRINAFWFKAKELGFDVLKDKNSTFRYLSQFFEKKDMRKVGTIVLKQAGYRKVK